MILVDTSAWIEYDRRTGSLVDNRLVELITSDGAIAVTEPILMETLAGARDDRAADDLRRLLTSFGWVTADSSADFEGAARVYRACRGEGVTPRGLIDCMVAAIALRTGSRVLSADRDFARIAEVVPLQIELPR